MKSLFARLVAICCLVGLAAAQGGVEILGPGCGGHGGIAASLTFGRVPRVGGSSQLLAANLPPQAFGWLFLGADSDWWRGLRLPLDLGAVGMPGCALHTGPLLQQPFHAAGGGAAWTVALPPDPSLRGFACRGQAFFAQAGLNAAGIGATPGLRARIGPPDAAVTQVTSIRQWGFTWTFAAPVPAGRFANGDWFVVGEVLVTDITPRTTVQQGRVLHGSMINPDPARPEHGYDGALYGPGNEHLYRPELNVAWGVTSSRPLRLRPGDSLISTESHLGNLVPQLEAAAVLTCVDEVPPHEAFRPPYAGADKRVQFDAGMLQWHRLQRVPLLPATPAIGPVADGFARVWLDHRSNWPSRMLHPVRNMPDYGRDLAAEVGQAALLVNMAFADVEKRPLVIRLVQLGIDNWGNVQNGCFWPGEGGHGSGRKFPILFAGALLGDAEMLGCGRSHPSLRRPDGSFRTVFGEDCQTFVVSRTANNAINFGFGSYTTADLGTPDWGFAHASWPNQDNRDWQGDPYRRCCTANAWVGYVLATRMMGLVDAWHHPPLFDYMDRYLAAEPPGWTRAWIGWTGDMWDAFRPAF